MASSLPLICWLLAVQSLVLRFPEQLLVNADDAALAREISRAARQHFHGEVEVVTGPDVHEPAASGTLLLAVHRSRSGGLQVTLSLGPSVQVRRTISLAEPISRLDAAEAVAIGLPDMLAHLRKSAQAPPRDAAEPRALPVPVLHAAPSMVGAKLATQGWPTPPVKEPPPAGEPPPGPPPEPEPAQSVTQAPPTVPPPQPQQRPIQRLTERQRPVSGPFAAKPERPSRLPPRPALGLLSAGAALVITGAGLGAAALSAAHQIDDPAPMPFDRDLDRRGKAFNVAAITLDVVGGLALAAGGAWATAWYLRRGKRPRPPVSLVRPLVVPGGGGFLLQGRF